MSASNRPGPQASPTTGVQPDGEDSGNAAQTFAIGFAIGGTLLLAGVIVVLVLQTRRKKWRTCFNRTSKDMPLVHTTSQLSAKSSFANGGTPHGTLRTEPSHSRILSRVSSFTNGSLNCFHPSLNRSTSPAGISLPATSTSPAVVPPPLQVHTLPPNNTSRDPVYSDPQACYRMPLDALVTSGDNMEEGDPHTYADPDATLSRRNPPRAEAGLEYGSVAVVEAQSRATQQDRKVRAATMHFTDDGSFDDGPYRTTELTRTTSLFNVPTATMASPLPPPLFTATGQQHPREPAYLVNVVGGGSWNRRVSAHSAAVPVPSEQAGSAGHLRTSSMSMAHRGSRSGGGAAGTQKASLSGGGQQFMSLPRGPQRASSLSNLVWHANDSKQQKQQQRGGGNTFPRPPLPPKGKRPSPAAMPGAALLSVPPKPPRVRHVDPDYVFVKTRPARATVHGGNGKSRPAHVPLCSSRSVPSRLHSAHKQSSSASNAGAPGQVAVVLNALPKPMVRMASSELVGATDTASPRHRQSPVVLVGVAEPLADLQPGSGCHNLVDTLSSEITKAEDSVASLPAISSVPEADHEDEDDDELLELEVGRMGCLQRRFSSLPDLSQLMLVSSGVDRVCDKWDFRMSAVQEGSRDESDTPRQASLENSFQQLQARKMFLQQRSSALDCGLKPPPDNEPDYWVLETQGSQNSFGSV